MYTFLLILIIVLAIALCLVVLVQKSKGGGLASGFASPNQIMGVPKMTDFIEKLTWGLAAGIVILSIATVYVLPTGKQVGNGSVLMDEAQKQQIENPYVLPSQGDATPINPIEATGETTSNGVDESADESN